MSAIIRAAIYARYSSDRSRDASIEDQVRVCREHADRHGWTVVEILQDAAISGASSFRPAYQTLLEHARSHRFDIVVAEALDRLSRDQSDVAGLYKQLNFAGIQISTVSEGLVNELHVAAKTHRGLRGRVEAGKSGGGLSYGYQLVRLGASTA
jgi:site-specific DNA recombinase